MSRLDSNPQRRCGCAETGGKATGPRSRARNITSGNRPCCRGRWWLACQRNSSRQIRCGQAIAWRWYGKGGKRRYKTERALGSNKRAGIYDLRVRCRDGWIRIYGSVRRVTLRSSFRRLAGLDCSLHLCRPTTRIARMYASVYKRLDGVQYSSLRLTRVHDPRFGQPV